MFTVQLVQSISDSETEVCQFGSGSAEKVKEEVSAMNEHWHCGEIEWRKILP
jgi:hypothetical protein